MHFNNEAHSLTRGRPTTDKCRHRIQVKKKKRTTNNCNSAVHRTTNWTKHLLNTIKTEPLIIWRHERHNDNPRLAAVISNHETTNSKISPHKPSFTFRYDRITGRGRLPLRLHLTWRMIIFHEHELTREAQRTTYTGTPSSATVIYKRAAANQSKTETNNTTIQCRPTKFNNGKKRRKTLASKRIRKFWILKQKVYASNSTMALSVLFTNAHANLTR